MSTIFFYIGLIFFVLLSLVLCLTILVQESKSFGLGASFGGDSGNSLFGTSTPQVLKKFTAYLAGIFFALCLLFSLWAGVISHAPVKAPQITIEGE